MDTDDGSHRPQDPKAPPRRTRPEGPVLLALIVLAAGVVISVMILIARI